MSGTDSKWRDSGNLLQHIDDAKEWLEQAKAQYKQANPLQGELILNLAQAEVKYAWELSRKRYVAKVKGNKNRSRLKFYLPLAASLVMISGVFLWQFGHKGPDSDGILAARDSQPEITAETPLPRTASPAVRSVAPETPAPDLPQIGSDQSAVNDGIAKRSTDTTEPDRISRTLTSGAGSKPVRQQGAAAETRNQLPDTADQVQANLQPVTEFFIDEEALTKEASRSLKIGK